MSGPDAAGRAGDAGSGSARVPDSAGPPGRAAPPAAIGIVGLGLVGGSLARDLAAAGWRVQGTDSDPHTEDAAIEAGVVEGPIETAGLDVLVLAVPVRAVPGWLHRLGPALGARTVVTDVGSTMRSAIEAAEAAGLDARFAGSHPMAGDHRSGWTASRRRLFVDATVWVCPTAGTTAGTLDQVEGLWHAVGARPRRIDADEHDRLVARASHVPQVAATALATVLARDGVGPELLGAGGRDMTRLATSDPDMWADILVDNGDRVGPALDALLDALSRFRRAVRDLDDATIRSLLAAGRAWSLGEQDPEAGVPGTRL